MRDLPSRRLHALIRAQHREDQGRACLITGSRAWRDASERLDELNEQIMYLARFGEDRREHIGSGMSLDLDSRPEEDVEFRQNVLSCVREAIAAQDRRRLIASTVERLGASERRMRLALEAIEAAQAALRGRYPDATLDAEAESDELDAVRMHAYREGSVA